MSQILDQWFRITKKIELVKFDKPELKLAKNTKYWIKASFKGRTYTTSAKNTYELFDYEVYNGYLEKVKIKEMNLTCIDIMDTCDNIFYTVTEFVITDSYNAINKISFNAGSKEENLVKAIKFMKEYGVFKSWESIELYKENVRLKEKDKGSRRKRVMSLKEIKRRKI